MRSVVLCVAAATALAGCCQEPPTDVGGAPPLLVTEAPSGDSAAVDPAERYPAGSRVLALDTSAPGGTTTVLSGGLAAAGGAVASHDGRRVLFVGKRDAADAYAVWTCSVSGAGLRRVAEGPGDCQGADFLPDGRFVFSAALPQPSDDVVRELFVAAEGEPAERITFGGGDAVDPAVLGDGRIVYAARPRADDDGFALFTVHPDGTGAAALHGRPGDAVLRSLPRQGPAGDVVFVARSANGDARVEILDWRAPAEPARTLETSTGVLAAAPAARGGSLLSLPAGGLRHATSDGGESEVYRPAHGFDVVHVSDATPRRRPQGHLSSIKAGTPYGTLLGLDARPDGARQDGAQQRAARVRLLTDRGPLGEVELASDGSFHVRVPADTPLRLEVVDEAGHVLSGVRTPFWVRPREVRGCIGCHEPSDVAPPNRAPLAALEQPVALDEPTRETER